MFRNVSHGGWHVIACEMFELGDCSADCGVGYTSGEYMCTENGTQFVCGMVNMTCNTEPCDGESVV